MAKQILGKIAYISKGEYSDLKNYEINDVVTYQGSSYVSLMDTQGNLPTDENFWMLLAAKGERGLQGLKGETGDPGPQGVPGIQGEQGENYILTDEDINTIKNEITENANSIFNQNVTAKTDAFNSNANTKTQDFNDNVETQTNAFSETVNDVLSSFESETSQYVKNADYANANKGGVIKINTNYGIYLNNGALAGTGLSTNDYEKANSSLIISKKTLDNILSEKIGSIDSILDSINGEVI